MNKIKIRTKCYYCKKANCKDCPHSVVATKDELKKLYKILKIF